MPAATASGNGPSAFTGQRIQVAYSGQITTDVPYASDTDSKIQLTQKLISEAQSRGAISADLANKIIADATTADGLNTDDANRALVNAYFATQQAAIAPYTRFGLGQALFTNLQYGRIALSDPSAPFAFAAERVSAQVAFSFEGLYVIDAAAFRDIEAPLETVFKDVNRSIYVDYTAFRNIYNDLGLEGVQALGNAYYGAADARTLIAGYQNIDSIQNLAGANGQTFREAASTLEGQRLLTDALNDFFDHEQSVVAEAVYRTPYSHFGNRTGGQIVKSDFDGNSALSFAAQNLGGITLGGVTTTFSGQLSNVNDRINFTKQLAPVLASAYADPARYLQLLKGR